MTSITTRDGVELFLHDWPVDHPQAIVALLHGYGEHAGRYAHVAEGFAKKQIGVCAVDLRGHGRSKGTRAHIDRFSDYHHDAAALFEHARQVAARAGGVPVFLFGHSMGGLLAIDWVLSGAAKDAAGMLLTSPFLGVALAVNPIKEALGRLMSRSWPTLALPTGLKGVDACRDPDLAAIYDTDPLNNKNATARWYTEAMSAIDRVIDRGGEIKLPVLLLYGGDDRIASAAATDRFARGLSGVDATVERMAGCAHELVNEPPEARARIIERMATWISTHR